MAYRSTLYVVVRPNARAASVGRRSPVHGSHDRAEAHCDTRLASAQAGTVPSDQDAGHLAALDDLGKRAVVQVTAHGLPAHAHLLRELAHAHALRVEAHDNVVEGQPPRTTLLAQQLIFRRLDYGQLFNRCRVEHRRHRCGLRHLIICMGHARQSRMLPGQQTFQRRAQIGQQMPAVRHLHSVRRATPRTFGVATTAITADDLNTRMSLQPGGQWSRWSRSQSAKWLSA